MKEENINENNSANEMKNDSIMKKENNNEMENDNTNDIDMINNNHNQNNTSMKPKRQLPQKTTDTTNTLEEKQQTPTFSSLSKNNNDQETPRVSGKNTTQTQQPNRIFQPQSQTLPQLPRKKKLNSKSSNKKLLSLPIASNTVANCQPTKSKSILTKFNLGTSMNNVLDNQPRIMPQLPQNNSQKADWKFLQSVPSLTGPCNFMMKPFYEYVTEKDITEINMICDLYNDAAYTRAVDWFKKLETQITAQDTAETLEIFTAGQISQKTVGAAAFFIKPMICSVNFEIKMFDNYIPPIEMVFDNGKYNLFPNTSMSLFIAKKSIFENKFSLIPALYVNYSATKTDGVNIYYTIDNNGENLDYGIDICFLSPKVNDPAVYLCTHKYKSAQCIDCCVGEAIFDPENGLGTVLVQQKENGNVLVNWENPVKDTCSLAMKNMKELFQVFAKINIQ